jgi:hypothetical protein
VPPSADDVRTIVRAIGVLLVVLDFGSLSFLLWRLEIVWWIAVPLGIAVGWFTAYELQWRYLLSPTAYRSAGSKARFIAAAAVIVLVNVGASSLLVFRLWYPYLFVRIVAALIGAWTWTRWRIAGLRASAEPPR